MIEYGACIKNKQNYIVAFCKQNRFTQLALNHVHVYGKQNLNNISTKNYKQRMNGQCNLTMKKLDYQVQGSIFITSCSNIFLL